MSAPKFMDLIIEVRLNGVEPVTNDEEFCKELQELLADHFNIDVDIDVAVQIVEKS